MRSILFSAVLLLSPALSLFGQQMGAFGTYTLPYYAEAIRLGGAYTAVGRGLASMHSNTAALAFQQGAQLQFSTGRSLLLEYSEFNTPYSFAASVHIPT